MADGGKRPRTQQWYCLEKLGMASVDSQQRGDLSLNHKEMDCPARAQRYPHLDFSPMRPKLVGVFRDRVSKEVACKSGVCCTRGMGLRGQHVQGCWREGGSGCKRGWGEGQWERRCQRMHRPDEPSQQARASCATVRTLSFIHSWVEAI